MTPADAWPPGAAEGAAGQGATVTAPLSSALVRRLLAVERQLGRLEGQLAASPPEVRAWHRADMLRIEAIAAAALDGQHPGDRLDGLLALLRPDDLPLLRRRPARHAGSQWRLLTEMDGGRLAGEGSGAGVEPAAASPKGQGESPIERALSEARAAIAAVEAALREPYDGPDEVGGSDTSGGMGVSDASKTSSLSAWSDPPRPLSGAWLTHLRAAAAGQGGAREVTPADEIVAEALRRLIEDPAAAGLLSFSSGFRSLHDQAGTPALRDDPEGDAARVLANRSPPGWRLARLAAGALLGTSCALRSALPPVTAALLGDAEQYFRGLERPDPEAWAMFMLDRVEAAVRLAAMRLDRLASVAARWEELIGRIPRPGSLPLARRLLLAHAGVTAGRLAQHAQLSLPGAHLVLQRLKRLGLVASVQPAVERVYYVPELLPQLAIR